MSARTPLTVDRPTLQVVGALSGLVEFLGDPRPGPGWREPVKARARSQGSPTPSPFSPSPRW